MIIASDLLIAQHKLTAVLTSKKPSKELTWVPSLNVSGMLLRALLKSSARFTYTTSWKELPGYGFVPALMFKLVANCWRGGLSERFGFKSQCSLAFVLTSIRTTSERLLKIVLRPNGTATACSHILNCAGDHLHCCRSVFHLMIEYDKCEH
jgi:hypothetical protein